MSQKQEQINIHCDSDTKSFVEQLEKNGEAESQSDAGRQLLAKGIEEYRRQQRQMPGLEAVRQMTAIGAVSTVLTVSVGIGLSDFEVLQLSLAFATATTICVMIYVAGALHARRGLR